jgi:RNA polymerase sigma factor (sigma-70 family)
MDTTPLTANLATFVNFVRSRTGDAELAADIVQDCLLKAIQSDTRPADDEASVQWFYRVLRHAIIDAHRRQSTRERTAAAWVQEWPEQMPPADQPRLCQCLFAVLPGLPPAEADLLRRIDLEGQSPSALAGATGERVNTLNVRLHRARRHLREQLERVCRTCAKHGCLDCECA